ncbi:MAG: tetratricopeptide repeat protein [Deltaproteobacteria bacterium]|nr:tetratricopeptide repeat protein [Deltaproteobacteria bacterium]
MRKLIVAGVLLACLPVRAGGLDEAWSEFRHLDYSRALAIADSVLASPDSGPELLLDAWRLQGLCYSALGRTDEAIKAFRKLLSLRPDFRLSTDISPKLAAPFYQAVAHQRGKGRLALKLSPAPGEVERLEGVRFMAVIARDSMDLVRGVRLVFWTEASAERRLHMQPDRGGRVVAEIPAVDGNELRYYWELLNEHGGVLIRMGQRNPFSLRVRGKAVASRPVETELPVDTAVTAIEVEPPRVPPPVEPKAEPRDEDDSGPAWYGSWWFWTAVGVVVAGATVGAAVGLTGGGGGPGSVTYHVGVGLR